ncbi:Hydroxyacylglutathione hydrolase [Candidatus Lokiarchaeum ossiferum]|uniref:Hydroxyacylglutathione hydrolase n=1 Tax=Candidatus Lokiarchaeum ossiferum TaxID=2951803 RepID=A0ABY6HYG8_9ARCH|nr:Hydroxyacylglutathione hydrolase [Candidatus Lokiarchaeum sp. B-35]
MFGKQRKKYYKEILPNLFYFSEGQMLDCNMYIIKDIDENLCLIDAGNGLSLSGLEAAIEELGWDLMKLKKILITHDHLDHIMGLYPLLEKFPANKPQIICHAFTADLLEEGDEKKVVPSGFGITADRFGINVIPLSNIDRKDEGDNVSFGDYSFIVYYTPGHSKGSICYYEPQKKLLFSGDVVFPQGSFGRYDFPGCSLADLKNSIKRIDGLDIETLCAGHMAPVEIGANRQISMSNRNINSSMW